MSIEPLVGSERIKEIFPAARRAVRANHRPAGRRWTTSASAFARAAFFGLVGESGSGKTTVGRTLLGLHDKTAGEVMFKGQALDSLSKEALRALRPKMQLVFQDPYSSLNPRLRVGDAIGEALLQHGLASKAELRERVLDTLSICGLSPQHYGRFPHEFSGGQRQRIGIARALILQPEFIVADEPISALDVSIQAQIINLFSDLQERQGGDAAVYFARSRRGRAPVSGRGGDVPGADRRECRPRCVISPAAASLHAGLAGGGADAGCASLAAAGSKRRAAQSRQPAARLPFSSALPAGHGAVP